MSTVSSLPGGKLVVAVKGAPETIKGMLSSVPEGYDDTYKWFTRRGSRVLALGTKEMEAATVEKVHTSLTFSRLLFTKVDEDR
jgi:manganese-transporting P-type ATPase